MTTHEHVLTRSVRDTAGVLDAIAGPGAGDPYTAPPPDAAVRATRSAPIRAGSASASARDVRRRTRRVASRLRRRGRGDERRLLEELGHDVEPDAVRASSTTRGSARPSRALFRVFIARDARPLEREARPRDRADGARAVERDAGGGRRSDVTAVAVRAGDRAAAAPTAAGSPRGGPTGHDLLVTPMLARAAVPARRARPARRPSRLRSNGWRASPASRCRSTSPASRRSRCRCTGTTTGCRSACSSSPPTGARTCCCALAAQLEDAAPVGRSSPPDRVTRLSAAPARPGTGVLPIAAHDRAVDSARWPSASTTKRHSGRLWRMDGSGRRPKVAVLAPMRTEFQPLVEPLSLRRPDDGDRAYHSGTSVTWRSSRR